MAALNDSAELVFKIKADSADAQKKIESFKKDLKGIEDAAKDQLTPLQNLAAASGISAAKFKDLQAGAVIAGAAVTAIAGAAAAAAIGIFNLLKSTSEYGSAIFDASQKTGLAAETISALKYAAETSGGSFEQVTGAVSKFNVMLGEAQLGSDKANETLKQFNVTARDTDTALAQAITTIAQETDVTKQAAAAKALFKDKAGALLPIIKSFDGDLPGLIKKLTDLGIVMSDSAAQASDEFGDTLDTLSMQAAATGRTFALELMPSVTRAMAAISASMAANKGEAAVWANSLINVFTGVGVAAGSMTAVFRSYFTTIDRIFGTTASNAINYGGIIRQAILNIVPAIGFLANLGETFGSAVNTGGLDASINAIKGTLDKTPGTPIMPKLGGGGGKSGGGGGGGGAKAGESDYERAVKQNALLLEAYKAGNENLLKENDRRLQLEEISEMEHAQEKARIKLAEIQYEIDLNNELLNLQKITDKEREEAIHKLGILETQRYGQEIQNAIDLRTQKEKDWDAELDAVEADGKARRANEKERADARKKLEEDLKRIKKLEAERLEDFKKWRQAEREKIDPYGVGKKKKGAGGDGVDWEVSGGGSFITGVVGALGAANEQIPILEQLGVRLADTFAQVGQAVGAAVKSFVLFGTAGTSFRKFAAEVIASIAQMSVVQAIFELAQGLAMSALFWFTGNPKYAKSATEHYVAAAVFGTIAGVATGVGRAVAGNQFQEGGGGSSSQNNSDPASQNNNFQSGQFGGFGQRLNNTLAAVEETTNRLANKIESFRPGDVLGMGVEQNPNAVSDGLISGLQNNSRLTGMLKRATGDAR